MAAIDVYLGTILSVDAALGLAMVEDMGGSKKATKLPILAYLPCNDNQAGVTTAGTIPVGTTVIYTVDPGVNIGYIISSANRLIADRNNTLQSRANYTIDKVSAFTDTALEDLLLHMIRKIDADLVNITNHAHQTDMDAYPGDYDIKDYKSTVGLHIGKYIAQLRGSTLSYIDLSGMEDKIRVVATTIEHHTDTTYSTTLPDMSSTNTAIGCYEALGVLSEEEDPVVIGDTGELELAREDAIPFYRLQSTTGQLIDGTESLVLIPPVDVEQHDISTEPIIVAKKRTALSGNITEASAFAVMSVKSPTIIGMHQVGYNQEPKDPLQDPDILQSYIPKEVDQEEEEEQTVPENDEERIRDAALDKLMEYALNDYFLDKIADKLADRGLIVASKEATMDKVLWEDKDTAEYGPTLKAAYPPPPKIEVNDPITGNTYTYYRSTSFISQEPDGSILLKDGYGSEIRLSQGNIYISPALDLFLRPGRDLSAMVPRHQSFNSQYSCTINSGDSIYIRAHEDLKVVAGTTEKGGISLESVGVRQSNDKLPGINIKSATGVGITGEHIYIGGKSSPGTTKKSVSNGSTNNSVVIDAGGAGGVMVKGGAYTVESAQVVMACHDGTFSNKYTDYASAITMTSNTIGIYATGVIMPSHLSMQGLKGTETVTLCSNGEQKKLKLKTASAPTLRVAGPMACYSNAMFKEGIAARGVVSISSFNAVAGDNAEEANKYFDEQKLIQDTVVGLFGKNTASIVERSATDGPYQDWFVNGNIFSFPLTYDVDTSITIPGMCWQRDAYNKGAGSYQGYTWVEFYIKDENGNETACYPGIDIWDTAKVSVGNNTKVPFFSDYITNTLNKDNK